MLFRWINTQSGIHKTFEINAVTIKIMTVIGVRDHFCLGGGGAQHFFARILYPCPKVEYVLGSAFFRTWGVFGGGEYYSFEVIVYRKPRRGRVWEGVCPSHCGDFFWILGY